MNAASTPGIESRARTRSSAAASMSGFARDGSAKQRFDDPLHELGRRQPRPHPPHGQLADAGQRAEEELPGDLGIWAAAGCRQRGIDEYDARDGVRVAMRLEHRDHAAHRVADQHDRAADHLTDEAVEPDRQRCRRERRPACAMARPRREGVAAPRRPTRTQPACAMGAQQGIRAGRGTSVAGSRGRWRCAGCRRSCRSRAGRGRPLACWRSGQAPREPS